MEQKVFHDMLNYIKNISIQVPQKQMIERRTGDRYKVNRNKNKIYLKNINKVSKAAKPLESRHQNIVCKETKAQRKCA